jgi:hypothetical protein
LTHPSGTMVFYAFAFTHFRNHPSSKDLCLFCHNHVRADCLFVVVLANALQALLDASVGKRWTRSGME